MTTIDPLAVDGNDDDEIGTVDDARRSLRRCVPSIGAVVVGLVVGAAVLRVLPWLGWFGDLLALALPLAAIGLAAVAAVCVVARRSRLVGLVAFGLLLSVTVGLVAPRLPQATAVPVRSLSISAVNLLFDNPTPGIAVQNALASTPDVLIVSELTRSTDRLLTVAFPYRLVRSDLLRIGFGEGVYSKFPLQQLALPTTLAGQALRVRVDGPTAFVLYAIHLPRPELHDGGGSMTTSIGGQRDDVGGLDRAADSETEPVVIAGDLNVADRTSSYAVLHRGRVDAVRSGWAGTTYVDGFPWELLMLRIDHVFIPKDWCSSGGGSFILAGSDHRGVQARIGPCPPVGGAL